MSDTDTHIFLIRHTQSTSNKKTVDSNKVAIQSPSDALTEKGILQANALKIAFPHYLKRKYARTTTSTSTPAIYFRSPEARAESTAKIMKIDEDIIVLDQRS